MEGINCRNVQKYVANRNQQVMKANENIPNPNLRIQSILGTHSQDLRESPIYILSAQEVLYYSSQYFLVHNLISKQNTVLKRQGCLNHKTIFINHFITQTKTDIIFTIQKYNNCLYIGQLQILGKLTQQNNTIQQVQSQNFRWKLSKLKNKCNYAVQNMSYHLEKNYVYMIAYQLQDSKKQKYLWVYDLNRQCMIMSTLIKPSISKITINRVWATEDPTEVYLMGRNYFRFWTLSFNQKAMKQSNYRNIQRSLYDKQILKLFYCYCQNSRVLGVLTEANLLLLKRNQLMDVQSPPERLIKKNKNKENIQLQLENSLNQIYRMKFLIDQEDNEKKEIQDFNMTPQTTKNLNDQFTCASQIWEGEYGDSITIATKSGKIMTYAISNGQMKLMNQINVKKSHHFDFITVSKKGEVIVLSEKKCQNLYIVNKYALNSEETGQQLKPFWGMGHINNQNIISIDSPALHQRVCTLGQNQNLKLWSFNGRQRKILFEQKLTNQASKIAMHPCGLLLAINYVKEIKLMGLLPTGVYEVMAAKTNYNSIGLKYSQCGNILVSNEQNLLMLYNPFTLKALGYIQPPQIKCTILDFQLTHDGNFIVYQTSDFALYIHPLELFSYNKFENMVATHRQRQVYKCFYFQQNIHTQDQMAKEAKQENIFVGCTEHKYMVLYKNYGKELIAQFPVEDCYIQALQIVDGWLFAATSKSTIRVYKWPIKQNQLQIQLIDIQKKIVKLKQPSFQQFSFWNDNKKITNFHKLSFSNKIVVAREGGSLTILNYNKFVAERYEQAGEKNKLTQIVNDTFFITKNESEKRNRLIEKTQGDILKVQIQISKEKSVLQRKFAEQCQQIQKNFQEKNQLNIHQKIQYLRKLKEENQQIKIKIDQRKAQIQTHQNKTKQINLGKKTYEEQRNHKIEVSMKEIVAAHKRKIEEKMDQHKNSIGNLKSIYREKIKAMKKEFQTMVSTEYPALISKKNIVQSQKNQLQDRKISIEVEYRDRIDTELTNWQSRQSQIGQLIEKVEEITKNNKQLEFYLQETKYKVRNAQSEDQNMQKEFQKYLEMYNSSRFTNLSLHSDVLKMRTQLIERKQIMQNKQEIINAAFQQRQKLQNYKQLVKGSLSKLQSRKEQLHNEFTRKENEVSLVFEELYSNLLQFQKLKMEEEKLIGLHNVIVKNKKVEQNKAEVAINRLKQLKRFLLLQGLTDDMQHKKMYVQRQNLLNNVNFYKKRLNMESIKQKKNKVLKKSALNLVLKQNKNLIEQCNQLRGQTIKYDHQIKNLGKKIGEANRMISIESKLKDQKNVVFEQRNQLQAIRALFTDQIATYQPAQIQQLDI